MIKGAGFFPSFGNGPPGVKVPRSQPYFDVSATPVVEYIFHGGVWVGAGDRQDFNATTLQGNNIAATAPADGQKLQWVTANNDWEPV